MEMNMSIIVLSDRSISYDSNSQAIENTLPYHLVADIVFACFDLISTFFLNLITFGIASLYHSQQLEQFSKQLEYHTLISQKIERKIHQVSVLLLSSQNTLSILKNINPKLRLTNQVEFYKDVLKNLDTFQEALKRNEDTQIFEKIDVDFNVKLIKFFPFVLINLCTLGIIGTSYSLSAKSKISKTSDLILSLDDKIKIQLPEILKQKKEQLLDTLPKFILTLNQSIDNILLPHFQILQEETLELSNTKTQLDLACKAITHEYHIILEEKKSLKGQDYWANEVSLGPIKTSHSDFLDGTEDVIKGLYHDSASLYAKRYNGKKMIDVMDSACAYVLDQLVSKINFNFKVNLEVLRGVASACIAFDLIKGSQLDHICTGKFSLTLNNDESVVIGDCEPYRMLTATVSSKLGAPVPVIVWANNHIDRWTPFNEHTMVYPVSVKKILYRLTEEEQKRFLNILMEPVLIKDGGFFSKLFTIGKENIPKNPTCFKLLQELFCNIAKGIEDNFNDMIERKCKQKLNQLKMK